MRGSDSCHATGIILRDKSKRRTFQHEVCCSPQWRIRALECDGHYFRSSEGRWHSEKGIARHMREVQNLVRTTPRTLCSPRDAFGTVPCSFLSYFTKHKSQLSVNFRTPPTASNVRDSQRSSDTDTYMTDGAKLVRHRCTQDTATGALPCQRMTRRSRLARLSSLQTVAIMTNHGREARNASQHSCERDPIAQRCRSSPYQPFGANLSPLPSSTTPKRVRTTLVSCCMMTTVPCTICGPYGASLLSRGRTESCFLRVLVGVDENIEGTLFVCCV